MNKQLTEIADIPTNNDRHRYNEAVKRDFHHNASCIVGFEFFWGMGNPFFLYATAVPAYMAELGAPKSLIGIIAACAPAMSPLQILISHYFRNKPRKGWLTWIYIAMEIPLLLYGLFFFCFPQFQSDTVQLAFFCISAVVLMAGCFGTFPVNFALITDCTPLNKRGSLYGYRIAAHAVGLLLMVPACRWVMQHWPDPDNYLVAFAIASAIRMVGSFFFLAVREHRDPNIATNKYNHAILGRLMPQIRLTLRKMFRSRNYKIFIFFIGVFWLAVTTGPFIIVFAKETMGIKGTGVLNFTIVHILSAALLSILLGKLADKVGYRIIGTIQGLLMMGGFVIASAVAFGCDIKTVGVYLAFLLYSGITVVFGMVMMNLSIELLPKLNIAMLIALSNTIMMPLVLIAPMLAGLIIDLTGSYAVVFVLSAVLSAVSALGFLFLVHEPRKRKIHVVKYIRRV